MTLQRCDRSPFSGAADDDVCEYVHMNEVAQVACGPSRSLGFYSAFWATDKIFHRKTPNSFCYLIELVDKYVNDFS